MTKLDVAFLWRMFSILTILFYANICSAQTTDNPDDSSSTPSYDTGLQAGDPLIEPSITALALGNLVDLFSGQVILRIPIAMPPGRGGVQPYLALEYSSARRNSWCGVGWDLSAGYIQRSLKKGVPKYNSSDTFEVSLNGVIGELIPIGNGEYRLKVESPFMRFQFFESYWLVTDKNGTKFTFGSADAALQQGSPGILKWYLQMMEDINGNYMKITYAQDLGQVYLDEINYTGNSITGDSPMFRVKFFRERRSDKFTSYKSGFLIKTRFRLSRIETYTADLSGYSLTKIYTLNYSYSPTTHRSLLASIMEYGPNESSLPPITFTYQVVEKGFLRNDSWNIPTWNLIWEDKDDGTMLIDLNGDALPDVIHAKDDTKGVYINTGVGWLRNEDWNLPDGNLIWKGEDDGRRLVDINGDILPDLLVARGDTCCAEVCSETVCDEYDEEGICISSHEEYYCCEYTICSNVTTWINNGYGWTKDPTYNVPGNFTVDVKDSGLRYADLNGDGLIDISYAKDDSKATWINTGHGWRRDDSWNIPDGNFVWHDTEDGRILVDVNGDSLVDLLVAKNGYKATYINTGFGWLRDDSWNIPAWNFIWEDKPDGTTLIDLNGDGLVDLIHAKDGDKGAYINNGHGWIGDDAWNLPDGNIIYQEKDDGRRFTDVNGDGLIDVVVAKNGYKATYLNEGPYPDILKEFRNGIGGSATITYAPSTKYENTFLPFILQVVNRVDASDGFNTYTTSYWYKDGLYEKIERDLRGFRRAVVTDAEGVISEVSFHQEGIRKGRIYEQITRDTSGNLFNRTINTWNIISPYTGVGFPYLAQQDNYLYDGDPSISKHTRARYTYDNFGNVTEILNDGDVSADRDEIFTYVEYAYNFADWVINRVAHPYVTDGSGKIMRQRWFYYDNYDKWGGNYVTKGNVTKEESWLQHGTNPIVIYDYDEYGNRITTTDANGHTDSMIIDTAYHIYPEIIINALGQRIKTTYNPTIGLVKSTTDPDGNTTIRYFDVFGRVERVIGPYDSYDFPTLRYEYVLSSIPGIPSKIISHAKQIGGKGDVLSNGASNYLTSISFLDGMGRVIQEKVKGENGRWIANKTVRLDSKGQIKLECLSFYTDSPEFTPMTTQARTAYTYDPLGRITKIIYTDETVNLFEYDHWLVTYVDPNGKMVKSLLDAYGRMVKRLEFNEGNIYITRYEYDPLGNLVKIADDQGNETRLYYDTLGRKIAMEDPDMGLWRYGYDSVGNLVSQEDANRTLLYFTYDAINRITQKIAPTIIDSPPGQRNPEKPLDPPPCNPGQPCLIEETVVNYEYDSFWASNSTGRLTKITDQTGSTTLEYNKLGYVTDVEKEIRGVPFTIKRSFDLLGRTLSINYPDGEQVGYYYNERGLLKKVVGYNSYLQNIEYNEIGEITLIQNGNGVITEKAYYPNNYRLAHIMTRKNHEILQDLSYSYDDIGTLLRIDDAVGASTQSFQYDDLYRLTKARGTYGIRNYRYDSMGNLIEKDGVGYTYSAEKPHAVVQGTDGFSATYDSNGNMVTINGQTYFYDVEGRLIEVRDPNEVQLVQYLYDGDGGRIAKIGKDGDKVIYIGKLYEIRPHYRAKHIFAGAIRLATVIEGGSTARVYNPHPGGPLPPGEGVPSSPGKGWGCGLGLGLTASGGSKNAEKILNFLMLLMPLAFILILRRKPLFKQLIRRLEVSGPVFSPHPLRNVGVILLLAIFLITLPPFQAVLHAREAPWPEPGVYYYHGDHLGSSSVITDKLGNLIQVIEYYPFGEVRKNFMTTSFDSTFKFTAQEYDAESELYFFSARYYNPKIGRFISPDPLVTSPMNPQNLNRYSYVLNNPLRYTDPTGLFFKDIGRWFKENIIDPIVDFGKRIGKYIERIVKGIVNVVINVALAVAFFALSAIPIIGPVFAVLGYIFIFSAMAAALGTVLNVLNVFPENTFMFQFLNFTANFLLGQPYSTIGLVLGLISIIGGATPHYRNGCLVFVGGDANLANLFGVAGIATGNMIFITSEWVYENRPGIFYEELAHTGQYNLFGASFLLVYGTLHLFYGYRNNPLERQARKEADRMKKDPSKVTNPLTASPMNNSDPGTSALSIGENIMSLESALSVRYQPDLGF
jgi:RHS repeat-associated protein